MASTEVINLIIANDVVRYVSVFVTGAITLQTVSYFSRFPNDRLLLKAFAAVGLCANILHVIAICWGSSSELVQAAKASNAIPSLGWFVSYGSQNTS